MDASSFRDAYEQFHAKVFRYFLKRTVLHATATELTQQLFIKLWQSRHTLNTAYSLEVQLFTMANSVWIDHLRREATSRRYFSPVEDLEALDNRSHDQPASGTLEATDHFMLAMHRLPPVRKKVFILKNLHGFSNQEIAGKLSVSVKTVEDHLWKAMRVIRSLLTVLLSIYPALPHII